MVRIGIPQALMFYRYSPLWHAIFRHADLEVVLSQRPEKGFIMEGDLPGPPEICLPVKLFLAHVNQLATRCDQIFIPRLISIERDTYNCPHFLGIPDVARAQCRSTIPVLDPIWNAKIQPDPLKAFVQQIYNHCGVPHSLSRKAIAQFKEIQDQAMVRFPARMVPRLFDQVDISQARFIIGIVGRPYILYEPELAGRIFSFFKKERCFLITPEMISQKLKLTSLQHLERPIFWYNCRENAGAAFSMFSNKRLNGLVQIVTFGCGPDSLIKELIDLHSSEQRGLPYLSLVIDQQSGLEAIQTRLEAFMDMVKRAFRRRLTN